METLAGWPLITLRSADLEVDVLPDKGADVLSARRRTDNIDVLWKSPWGLRRRGALSAADDSTGRLMEAYPGGWQTVFPNGGDPSPAQGTTWGMHGEVWLSAFEVVEHSESSVRLATELVHSPFRVEKLLTVDGPTLTVTETISCRSGHPVDTMWSHHPAFGAPLLAPGSVIQTSARTLAADVRHEPGGDIEPGGSGQWPYLPGRSGERIDLGTIPQTPASRMAYLDDFSGTAWIRLSNPALGLGAQLDWDAALMPQAWYWLEAHASPGFPWYQKAFVLGLEPATSIPGHGISHADSTLEFQPGQQRTTAISLTITDGSLRS